MVCGQGCFSPAVKTKPEFLVESVNFLVRRVKALDLLWILIEHSELCFVEIHEVHD